MGHFFGLVGVLAGISGNIQCVPIFISIQEGYYLLEQWQNLESLSHIERVVSDAIIATLQFGKSYLVLDRFFLSRPLLCFLNDNDLFGNLDVIVRAKMDVVGYEDPPAPTPHKRGPHNKKGAKVKISQFFDQMDLFKTVNIPYYGEKKDVSYFCIDLLWGQGLYQKVRFVLSVVDNKRSIFVTTDLQADPVDVITAYTYRFKIEQCFKDLIHIFGGMNYHFWSKAVPKSNKYVSLKDSWENIKSQKDRKQIQKAVKAIHTYTTCSIVAMGICQLLCFKFNNLDWKDRPHKRTWKSGSFSLCEMRTYLQMHLLALSLENPNLVITKIILRAFSRF